MYRSLLKRINYRYQMLWLIIAVSAVWAWPIWTGSIQLGPNMHSIMELFEQGFFFSDGKTTPAVFFLASLPAVSVLYQELNHDFGKISAAKAGFGSYLTAWRVTSVLSAFAVSLAGLALYFLVIAGISAWFHYPLIREASDRWVALPTAPILGLAVRCLIFSIGAAGWSELACLVLIRKEDLFIALIFPVALYLGINYLLTVYFHFSLDGLYMNPNSYQFAARAIRSLIIVSCVAGLLNVAVAEALRRRVSYESII